MSRLQSQILTAPAGMDYTTQAETVDPTKCRLLCNYQVDRGGYIRATTRSVSQLPSPSAQPIDGMGYFYGAQITNNVTGAWLFTDLVMWVSGAFLWIGVPAANPLTDRITSVSFVEGGITNYIPGAQFKVGKRPRFFALMDEMVIVQDGGLVPLRYYAGPTYGSGLYQAGIPVPTSSGTYANLTVATSGTGLTGTWDYKLTFSDERGRRSSPTIALPITLTNQGTLATWDTGYAPGTYIGSHFFTAELYRNTQGAPSTFYQIQQITIGLATSGNFAVDNAADSTITSGALAPNPGENDPPNPASVGIVYKNHVVLNDVTNPNSVQISNLLSTTQYTSVPTTPLTATDGIRSNVGTDQGNIITGFAAFGSYLAVFKRRNTYYLTGDTIDTFVVQPMWDKGCIAPDSIVRCDDVILFLADDGIYETAYAGGDTLHKISKEIEDIVFKQATAFAATITAADREAASALYINRQYRITIGEWVFCYDFDRLGWAIEFYGSGVIPGDEGCPDVTVMAGSGFTVGLADAGQFGASVDSMADAPLTCGVSVSPTSIIVDSTAQSYNLTITASNSASIPYSSNVSWARVNGPSNGSGIATVGIDANEGGPRVGQLFICDQVIPVNQGEVAGGCSMTSLTPSSFSSVSASGAVESVRYVQANDDTIMTISDSAWVTIGSPVNDGFRTGTIALTVAANTGCSSRSAVVTVCDETVSISQLADTVALSPAGMSFSGAGTPTQTITVTDTGGNLVWNIVHDSWIIIDSATGVGSGTIVIHCADNTHQPLRSGSVSICGVSVTVGQSS